MKYNLLRIDWILLSSLFVVSRFMWTCQFLWVVLPCHVSGIEHYLAISDQLRADLRSCYWGGGEKRKPSSSFLPLPLPFFFCLPSLQLSRNNWIGNACYAGFFSAPQRPLFRRSLARSLVPWPTVICSCFAPLKRYPGHITSSCTRGKGKPRFICQK